MFSWKTRLRGRGEIQILTSLLIGAAMALALWLLGVNQPLVWGVIAGILNSVPYFGPVIVTVGLALVAFLQFGSAFMVMAVAGVTLAITSADGLLIPVLTGRVSRMNTVAIFVAVLFWGWLWGAIGLLLAAPVMMVIKTVCDRVEGLYPIAHLLSNEAGVPGEGK